MDTFDNNDFDCQPIEDPVTPPQPEQTTYHSTGSGRKESPYADSPYAAQSHQEYEYQPQRQPKPPKKSGGKTGRRILAAVLALVLVAGGCLITAASVNAHWEKRTRSMEQTMAQQIEDLQKQIAGVSAPSGSTVRPALPDGTSLTPGQLYAQNVSSVVAITSTVVSNGFYGASEGTASGSGFILTQDGYVITNHHVIEGAASVEVTTYDGTAYPAQVVGSDSTNDLAVLKIEAEGLPAATVGRSSDLVIGDMVVAIGNPLGKLQYTQTVGYVSGINREVNTSSTSINMIQTDAAINPGNSGGPLFNMRGEVIGITTAKYSNNSSSGASIEGLGFAIPIDDVMNAISQLIDNGYVSSAYMDIMVQNTDAESAARYNLPTGAYVVSVGEGGAADRAGILPKDIITSLGGTTVKNTADLTRALRNYSAGDTTTVTVVRSGGQLTLDITLDERPRDADNAPAPDPQTPMPESGDYNEWFDYFRRYFEG